MPLTGDDGHFVAMDPSGGSPVDPDSASPRPVARGTASDCSEEEEPIREKFQRSDPSGEQRQRIPAHPPEYAQEGREQDSVRFQTDAQVLDMLAGLERERYPRVEVEKVPAAIARPRRPVAGYPAAPPRRSALSQVTSYLIYGTGIFIVLFLLVHLIFPVSRFVRSRAQGQATACKSNLKNIGTAIEMYSTDNLGRFPRSLMQLVPRYLKPVPSCPSAGSVTCSRGYSVASSPDGYTVVCGGNNHYGVGYNENYPQYTSTQGLLER